MKVPAGKASKTGEKARCPKPGQRQRAGDTWPGNRLCGSSQADPNAADPTRATASRSNHVDKRDRQAKQLAGEQSQQPETAKKRTAGGDCWKGQPAQELPTNKRNRACFNLAGQDPRQT